MRMMAVRNKARDVRLIAVSIIALCLVCDSRWDKTPLVGSAFLASGVFLAGMAAVVRAWAILYIAGHKTGRLITVGPFSITRNPIYLSSLMGGLGVALDTGTITVPLFFLAMFFPYFYIQVAAEEAKLATCHGGRFAAYRARTPRLWPNFRLLEEPTDYDVRPHAYRRWLVDALWFVWGLGVVEVITTLHEAHLLPVLVRFY